VGDHAVGLKDLKALIGYENAWVVPTTTARALNLSMAALASPHQLSSWMAWCQNRSC